MCNSKYKNWQKLIWPQLKSKIYIKNNIFTNSFKKLRQGIFAAVYTYKLIKKKNPPKFHVLEACKNHVIWLANSVKSVFISIIQFSWGEGDQVSGTTFMLLLVVKFSQILHFSSTHFGIHLMISIEIYQEIKLISITYVKIL